MHSVIKHTFSNVRVSMPKSYFVYAYIDLDDDSVSRFKRFFVDNCKLFVSSLQQPYGRHAHQIKQLIHNACADISRFLR